MVSWPELSQDLVSLFQQQLRGFPCSPYTAALQREENSEAVSWGLIYIYIKASKDCQWKDLLPFQHCQEQPISKVSRTLRFSLRSVGSVVPFTGMFWEGCHSPRTLSVLRGLQKDLGNNQGSGLLMKQECLSKNPTEAKAQMYKCCAITRHHLCIKCVFPATPTS